MSQHGTPQQFRMDGQGTQSGDKGQGRGFQAGGPTGPYPVGKLAGEVSKDNLARQEAQHNKVLCSRLTS